jgi:hypothetical protein
MSPFLCKNEIQDMFQVSGKTPEDSTLLKGFTIGKSKTFFPYSLHENYPKLFWKTIDKLKKDTKTQENPISLSSWTTYLKELYDDKLSN